jgi:hypothetical protein
VVVDFAPLPVGQTDFALYYKFYGYGDTGFEGVRHITTETATEVRDHYRRELMKSKWAVEAVGETKLVIYGPPDDAPRKVEFRVDTFEFKPKGNVTPTTRREKRR